MDERPTAAALIDLDQVEVVSAGDAERVRVRGCTWRVCAGDYWVVAGPHGSGKSDVLGTAAGLQGAGAGAIRWFGQAAAGMSQAQLLATRLRIGFVFKGGGRMFEGLTVAENIALPLRYHRDWEHSEAKLQETVGAILQMTGLEEWTSHTASRLGANWHPRVGLARALALGPEILFLDEPLAGLEQRHRRWWLDFLDQLAAGTVPTEGRPVTLVASTNDFGEWIERARQFALIEGPRWRVLEGRKQAAECDRAYLTPASSDADPPEPAPAI